MSEKKYLLLKTMLKSTSNINILRHSHDKKVRGRAWGYIIGEVILDVFILFAGAGLSYVFSSFGYAEVVPMMTASLIALFSLVFTFLKTNEYLFGFKQYDLIMSMPFSVKTVVTNRFLYMFAKDLPWNMLIAVSTLMGYALYNKPPFWVYPMWLILSVFVAAIPMLIAAALGAITLRLTVRFKSNKILQIILTFIIVIPCFFSNYIIQYLLRDNRGAEVIDKSSAFINSSSKYIPGVVWFTKAVTHGSISSMLLLVGVSCLLYAILFSVISRSYRMINTKLSTSLTKHRTVTSKEYKVRNVYKTIAFKEFKRLMGSTAYAVNAGLGVVVTALVSVVLIFVNLNKFAALNFGTEFDIRNLGPLVPIASYFMLGMVPTTCCSTSLEGKNYWILKSLPFDMFTVCKGKMLFNIYMTVPVGIFSIISGCFSLRAALPDYICGIIFIVCACSFSTAFGMVTGIKFKRLDWDNEIEVIKQGAAVSLYLLPNMIFSSIAGVLVIVASLGGAGRYVILALSIFYAILATVCYFGVKELAKKA